MTESPDNATETRPRDTEIRQTGGEIRQDKFRDLLVNTPEGRVLLVGLALTAAYLLWLMVVFIIDPDHAHAFIGMTATEIIFGRAACMTLGYSFGLGNLIVIPVCIVVETILVLLVYGVVALGCRQLSVFKWLNRTLDRINRAAEANKDKIKRYGIIGLFFFVWFPFWMTGPVVGCVIGYFLGLRTWINMTVVLSGTYLAIFGWAFFLKHVHGRLAAYSPYGSVALFAVIIGIVVVGHQLHKRRHKKQNTP